MKTMKVKETFFSLIFAITTLAAAAFDGNLSPQKATVASNETMTPYFSFTRAQWEATLTELPPEIRSAICAEPQLFLKEAATLLDSGSKFYRHIDRETPINPIYSVPTNMVDLSRYAVDVAKPIKLHKSAAVAFAELSRAAKANGIHLTAISGYRSYVYQKQLYSRLENTVEKAKIAVLAPPGYSQHQTGLALDINSLHQNFGKTPAGRWLAKHAGEYGWSLSYPEDLESLTGYDYEPWHFRYITKEGARLQRRFFADIQFYFTRYFDEYDFFYKEYRIRE